MKRTILVVVFVVVAAGLIGLGASYSSQISQQSQQSAVDQGAAAQQTQSQAMQNLKITDTVAGTGAVAAAGDTVNVLYTGKFDDGTVFDASSLHGNQPFTFILGARQVIQGWDLGLVGMKVGGTRELTIPPELGYGSSGQGPIPPNATLHFTVKLLSISTSSAGAGQ
jgi:FKBP-type peptidyl-prolyl cis-trans isomerase FkpA